MTTCSGCGGLVMEPGLAYGYAGKVCQCHLKLSGPMYLAPLPKPLPKLVPQDDPV